MIYRKGYCQAMHSDRLIPKDLVACIVITIVRSPRTTTALKVNMSESMITTAVCFITMKGGCWMTVPRSIRFLPTSGLPFVYGPGDYKHRIFEYLKPMDDQRPAILLDQERAKWRWTWGYVEDVADAIACAATDKRAAGIYNVGERVSLTQAERVKTIAAAAGWNGRVIDLPESQLPDHLKAVVDFAQDLTFDTVRIRNDIGYEE